MYHYQGYTQGAVSVIVKGTQKGTENSVFPQSSEMSRQGKGICLPQHWLQVSILYRGKDVVVLTDDPGRCGAAGLSGHSTANSSSAVTRCPPKPWS